MTKNRQDLIEITKRQLFGQKRLRARNAERLRARNAELERLARETDSEGLADFYETSERFYTDEERRSEDSDS